MRELSFVFMDAHPAQGFAGWFGTRPTDRRRIPSITDRALPRSRRASSSPRMGTSLLAELRARSPDPFGAIERAITTREEPLAARPSRTVDAEGRPLLELAIHPAAEPVRITELGAGKLTFEAITGTAG